LAITETALALQGVPYRDGGETTEGFDCSGFTRYVFAQHGINLPRLASDQYLAGDAISVDDLEPGDLVFFTTVAPGASHVGVSAGGDRFVHAPGSHGHVRVERLSSSYWSERYIGARRIVAN
jgi:cell wall-associated NlpC family hydrolase